MLAELHFTEWFGVLWGGAGREAGASREGAHTATTAMPVPWGKWSSWPHLVPQPAHFAFLCSACSACCLDFCPGSTKWWDCGWLAAIAKGGSVWDRAQALWRDARRGRIGCVQTQVNAKPKHLLEFSWILFIQNKCFSLKRLQTISQKS